MFVRGNIPRAPPDLLRVMSAGHVEPTQQNGASLVTGLPRHTSIAVLFACTSLGFKCHSLCVPCSPMAPEPHVNTDPHGKFAVPPTGACWGVRYLTWQPFEELDIHATNPDSGKKWNPTDMFGKSKSWSTLSHHSTMPVCLHTWDQKSSWNSPGFPVMLFTVIGETWRYEWESESSLLPEGFPSHVWGRDCAHTAVTPSCWHPSHAHSSIAVSVSPHLTATC